MLSLIESGELTELFNKWWFENTDCDPTEKQETARNELSLRNVAGIFFILIGGLILSLIVALLELFINKRHNNFIQTHHQMLRHHHNHHHHHQQSQPLQSLPPHQHLQNSIQTSETIKTKLTIPPDCDYDNNEPAVSK